MLVVVVAVVEGVGEALEAAVTGVVAEATASGAGLPMEVAVLVVIVDVGPASIAF